MTDLPLVQLLPSLPPTVAGAVAGLLCAVLGDVQVVDGLVTAVADEATVVASLVVATGMVNVAAGTEFEQARWRAAGAKSVASA